MPQRPKPLPEWERILTSAAHLQDLFPGAVLVGGTAAAIHAHHRGSIDADHVLTDLAGRFDAVLAQLESVAGWKTARIRRPVQILGSLDGIETGVRQLIRNEPLETERITVQGYQITVPTKAEMLRIKAVLILKRNATRDYIDFAALRSRLGNQSALDALMSFDRLYPQPNGESPTQQLLIQLANPLPFDLSATNLAEFRNLAPQWRDWKVIAKACSDCSTALATALRSSSQAPAVPLPQQRKSAGPHRR